MARWKPAAPMAPDDPRHGTVNGYVNRLCRCDACREAWRLYEPARRSRERYSRRIGHRPWAEYVASFGERHGRRVTYKNGCRCDACRRAEREYRAAYRKRSAA